MMPLFTNYEQLENQIRGLIYGQAIGDTIGLLTEFMSKDQSHKCYGKIKNLEFTDKLDDGHRMRWDVGDWTDDTDQMILIILSLLDEGGVVSPCDFAKKLVTWMNKGFPELGDFGGMGIGFTTGCVLRHKDFLSDPHQTSLDVWTQKGCRLAPNGALMRTCAVGAFKYDNLKEVHVNALDFCKVTHADPRCQASVIAMVTAISLMLQREERLLKKDSSYNIDIIIKESYEAGKALLEDKSYQKELKQYMFASSLKDLKLDEFGKIGYTYKCLGAGFWALKQDDYRTALHKLIMEGGDADTNGAVAGALLGCKLAMQGLPPTWLGGLLHKQWLDKIVDRFLVLIIPCYERQYKDDDEGKSDVAGN